MVKVLKDVYGLIYGELAQTIAAREPLHWEIEKIKNPLRGREDFKELGFISGFKYGVAFMVECMEWPGQE